MKHELQDLLERLDEIDCSAKELEEFEEEISSRRMALEVDES